MALGYQIAVETQRYYDGSLQSYEAFEFRMESNKSLSRASKRKE